MTFDEYTALVKAFVVDAAPCGSIKTLTFAEMPDGYAITYDDGCDVTVTKDGVVQTALNFIEADYQTMLGIS